MLLRNLIIQIIHNKMNIKKKIIRQVQMTTSVKKMVGIIHFQLLN